MKEILEKIEELKKLGVSVRVLSLYEVRGNNFIEEFDEFCIHPHWGEDVLKTELTKKLVEAESHPWLFHLKRSHNINKLCDTCTSYNFKYTTTMQSIETPIKIAICSRGHFNEVNDNLINVTICKNYIKSNG